MVGVAKYRHTAESAWRVVADDLPDGYEIGLRR